MGNFAENLNLGNRVRPPPCWKHRELGRHQRRVQGVNQSVNIQLPSAEDGEGFL